MHKAVDEAPAVPGEVVAIVKCTCTCGCQTSIAGGEPEGFAGEKAAVAYIATASGQLFPQDPPWSGPLSQ